jgi:cytidylate kinase
MYEKEEDMMAIITLARGTFSGARKVAENLSEGLGYKLVSREDIIERIVEYGISGDRLERGRCRHLGMLPRRDLEWIHYLAYTRAALSKEVRQGNLVYLGDDGRILLRNFPTMLSVHVTADMGHRIDAFMRRNDYAVGRKEAKRFIKKIDANRARWGRILYNDGLFDPSEFDLVIDPGLMSIPDACEVIRAAIEQPRFQTTPESLKTLECMTLAAELRARIAMEADVVDDNIEVEVRDGAIKISGSVHSAEDADAIRELLRKQPEVEDVELQALKDVSGPPLRESASIHP